MELEERTDRLHAALAIAADRLAAEGGKPRGGNGLL
jgi:hypothetical protein